MTLWCTTSRRVSESHAHGLTDMLNQFWARISLFVSSFVCADRQLENFVSLRDLEMLSSFVWVGLEIDMHRLAAPSSAFYTWFNRESVGRHRHRRVLYLHVQNIFIDEKIKRTKHSVLFIFRISTKSSFFIKMHKNKYSLHLLFFLSVSHLLNIQGKKYIKYISDGCSEN